ncbi:hypothetical protein [Klebsiella aerogenes]|uniref:hypothetical protein n=1 Tax=Klebsiella aerogenes TaxID=548 RepID=UPI0034D22C0F
MNEQELIAAISCAGRYEVISNGAGEYVCIPIATGAMVIPADAHEECKTFFRSSEE